MSTEEVFSDDFRAPLPRKDMAAPPTEWGLLNHFKLMDLRDCPHNYITAFQQPFELHTCSLDTPQHFIHIIAPHWNVLWQIWPFWALWNKVALHGTGNPLIPLRTSPWIQNRGWAQQRQRIKRGGQRKSRNRLSVKEMKSECNNMHILLLTWICPVQFFLLVCFVHDT